MVFLTLDLLPFTIFFKIFTVCNIIFSYHVYINTTYVYSLYIALTMLRCRDETLAN